MSRKFNVGSSYKGDCRLTFTITHRFQRPDGTTRVVAQASDNSGSKAFEVLVIRTASKDIVIRNILARAKGDEFLPKPSEWGIYGWTPTSLNRALQIAQE